jgi:hypothetical protein
VPSPTNQRTRIFPSEVNPPALDGCAVTSAPVGLGVDDGEGASVCGVHAPTISTAAIPTASRVRQSLCCTFFLLSIVSARADSFAAFSGITPTRATHDELGSEHDAARYRSRLGQLGQQSARHLSPHLLGGLSDTREGRV